MATRTESQPKAKDKTKELLDGLNEDLRGEFQAIIMYRLYASMVQGPWRQELRAFFANEIPEELGHAQILADKISSLGGTPAAEPSPVKVVKDAKAMLETALAAEIETIDRTSSVANRPRRRVSTVWPSGSTTSSRTRPTTGTRSARSWPAGHSDRLLPSADERDRELAARAAGRVRAAESGVDRAVLRGGAGGSEGLRRSGGADRRAGRAGVLPARRGWGAGDLRRHPARSPRPSSSPRWRWRRPPAGGAMATVWWRRPSPSPGAPARAGSCSSPTPAWPGPHPLPQARVPRRAARPRNGYSRADIQLELPSDRAA